MASERPPPPPHVDSAHGTDSPAAQGSDAPPQDAAVTEPSSPPPAAAVEVTAEPREAGEAEHRAPTDAADSGSDDGDAEETTEADASADAPKKKKRRRKKKKPTSGAEGAPEGAGPSAPPSARRHHPRPAMERAPFHVGEETFGKVTAVLDTAIMIDLSGKALAIFDRLEMEPDDLVPSVGDRFVARIHNDGLRGGLVVMTRKPLREEEAKPRVEQAHKDGALIQGLVTGVIKGGVEVDIDGLRAFAPASGMDLHPGNANFAGLVGQRLDFKVADYKSQGRDVVVTRRPMLEQEARERRKHALTLLSEGQVLEGVVRTVVEWGAFVALPAAEGLEGLIHVSEASHDPRAKLAELMKPGDRFDVKITKVDERGKIWLSRKALVEDPWAAAKLKFAPGTRHAGKVTRVEKYGAFVELEPGLEGMVHVSDLSFERVETAASLVSVGQDFDVVVVDFDVHARRIGLQPPPPPGRENEEPQRIVKYGSVKAEVLKADPAGLVVRILGVMGRAARGFVPAGQTGTQRGTDLRKHFKQGAIIEAKIIDLDRNEPKLSIRGLAEDEEKRATKEYRQKLKAESSFGTLGDLLAKRLSK